ncbi:monoterpene synthase TPS4, chloroplastic-like [Henckelia pumila]|uniref:monoterpene synthase TPS4, chloroplastic-like n=1 Tax=Henckelia pumila TaxID=405737 RepID=UPI003C6E6463
MSCNSDWLKKPLMNSRFPKFLRPAILMRASNLINEKPISTRGIEELKEKKRKELKRLFYLEDSGSVLQGMKLIDNLQWLGVAHHFEDEIDFSLEKLSQWHSCGEDHDDLHSTALRFRLLRQHMKPISCDVFEKFVKDENIRKSLIKDKEGLLNLYEASYLGSNDEDIILFEAMKFSEIQLKTSVETMRPDCHVISRRISRALELPRHRRMVRLESRLGIEEYYDMQTNHSCPLLQLAKLDYNNVQLLHQMELTQLTRWWKQLGVGDKLGHFARNSMGECFLWTVGIFPNPKYSEVRVEMAKVIAILLVIDDVFDKYGTFHDLSLFTRAIQRWDANAIETLPEYMKVCYMALYNTTKEIAHKVLKQLGKDIHHLLKGSWIHTVEAYMIEFKWFSRGEQAVSAEEYVENGVATAGAYMALVHAFFLMGEGLTDHNIKLMSKPYPKLFSASGRILRLWDDLGTSKEEEDRGDNASIIGVLMKEKNLSTENEAQQHIKQLILKLWKDLNGNLVDSNPWPLSIINVCFNMSRTAQVFYQHQQYSYASNVKNIADSIFWEPIEL